MIVEEVTTTEGGGPGVGGEGASHKVTVQYTDPVNEKKLLSLY